MRPRALTLLAALALLGACIGLQEPDSGVALVDVRLRPVTGGSQTGPAGARLAEPLRVRATTDDGRPFAGVPLTFVVVEGGGRVEATEDGSATTDANGVATARWTLGPVAGPQLVEVRLGGTPSVAFRATATEPRR